MINWIESDRKLEHFDFKYIFMKYLSRITTPTIEYLFMFYLVFIDRRISYIFNCSVGLSDSR